MAIMYLARLSIISLCEYGTELYYVAKEVNPGNVLKARPIEDFWIIYRKKMLISKKLLKDKDHVP
ncbi:hypothetical protein BpHYR1_010647 [Brachionus plicatilis]|uniref:Uncharacterized protein n=1 Tax=Brachionus plicatilis TaxID=10195 RepID=A0A3M7PBX6_BRAPC|nr:hypothetical protein BpHYR1_010647 [Brachionus plicatilis]